MILKRMNFLRYELFMFWVSTQSHHLPLGSDNAGVAGTSHCLYQEWTREPWPHHLLYHCPPPQLTLQCSVSPLLQRVLLQCLETSDAAPHLALRPVTRDNVTYWGGESLVTPGLVHSYSLPLSRHSHLVQIVVGVPWSENIIRKINIFKKQYLSIFWTAGSHKHSWFLR